MLKEHYHFELLVQGVEILQLRKKLNQKQNRQKLLFLPHIRAQMFNLFVLVQRVVEVSG